MACECEQPVRVVDRTSGWSEFDWNEVQYCGNCGELFARRVRKRRRPRRKRRPLPEAVAARLREPREKVSPLHVLQVGDKLRVTAVHAASQRGEYQEYRWTLSPRTYVRAPERVTPMPLAVGATYRVVKRPESGYLRLRVAERNTRKVLLVRVGEPRHHVFLCSPDEFDFEQVW